MRLDANGVLSASALTFPGGVSVSEFDDPGGSSDDAAESSNTSASELLSEALLTEVYNQYSAAIHSYAYKVLGNQEDADDVTQDTFIKVYYRLGQLRDAARLRSWLYKIATNLCYDQLRKRARTRKIFGLSVSLEAGGSDSEYTNGGEVAQPGSTTAIDGVAERDVITRVLQRMSHKYAVCLILHSAQGLNYREVAAVLGIAPGAAAVRLARAKKMFGRYYDEQQEEKQ